MKKSILAAVALSLSSPIASAEENNNEVWFAMFQAVGMCESKLRDAHPETMEMLDQLPEIKKMFQQISPTITKETPTSRAILNKFGSKVMSVGISPSGTDAFRNDNCKSLKDFQLRTSVCKSTFNFSVII